MLDDTGDPGSAAVAQFILCLTVGHQIAIVGKHRMFTCAGSLMGLYAGRSSTSTTVVPVTTRWSSGSRSIEICHPAFFYP
jgi:hypothetical protein